jgi:hypothetical protein
MGAQRGKADDSNNNGGKRKSVRFGGMGQTDTTSVDAHSDDTGSAQNFVSAALGGSNMAGNESLLLLRENVHVQQLLRENVHVQHTTEAAWNKTDTDSAKKSATLEATSGFEAEGERRVLPVRRADPSSLLSELTRYVSV